MKKARLRKKPPKDKVVGQPLTARESDVLWLLIEGMSNKVIADKLDLSEHTVKFHVPERGAEDRDVIANEDRR